MFFKITESARIFVNYEDFVNTDFKKIYRKYSYS